MNRQLSFFSAVMLIMIMLGLLLWPFIAFGQTNKPTMQHLIQIAQIQKQKLTEPSKEEKQLVEITKAMDLILREPGSGQYKLGGMIKGECYEQVPGVFYRAINWRGDAMNFLANGKNAYGGYTGFQPYTALFDDTGKVVMILDGADFGRYGFPLGFPTVNEAGLCTKF